MKIISLILFKILIIWQWNPNPISHPLKLSTCVITCSPETREIKLNFHFFQDDFGEHLSRISNQDINFDQNSEEIDSLIKHYIVKNFELSIEDVVQDLQWVKAFREDIVEYVHFSIPERYCNLPISINIKNTLMLDAFEKQSNLVRIDLKGDKNFKTLRFDKSETELSTVLK